MKIVRYIGGLGNQMFTYAFSLALEKRYKERIYSDILYYRNHKFHNGFELTNVFDVNLQMASVWDVIKLTWFIPNYHLDFRLRQFIPSGPRAYVEKTGGAYDEKVFQYKQKGTFYWGFWQDHRYFDEFREDIINALSFKRILTGRNHEIAETINNSINSVGIHIRRGDYLKHSKYMNICTLEYYKKAIAIIKKRISKPTFYMFSNDIEWCQKNIVPLLGTADYILIDWNKGEDSYIDMQLMSLCNGLIIANSSFSWWGAYLNKRNPIVVAPKKWINNAMHFVITMDEWITI